MEEVEEVFYYDWYDGPRTGVSNFMGSPHYFESQWVDLQDNAEDVFYLSPVSEEIRDLAKESWAIWKRWEIAFNNGEVNKETHPYLPEDEARGKEIENLLKKNLKINKKNCLKVSADFILMDGQEEEKGLKKFWVKWKK